MEESSRPPDAAEPDHTPAIQWLLQSSQSLRSSSSDTLALPNPYFHQARDIKGLAANTGPLLGRYIHSSMAEAKQHHRTGTMAQSLESLS